MKKARVSKNWGGQRADKVLSMMYPQFARSAVAKLFAHKQITKNGELLKPGEKLHAGDQLIIDDQLLVGEPPQIGGRCPNAGRLLILP